MKLKFILILLLLIGISHADLPASYAQPIPDIKANGSDGPVSINATDTLSVTTSLDAGGNSSPADWWVVAKTPSNVWFYYSDALDAWFRGFEVSLQEVLADSSSDEVLNISGLPTGTYSIYFGVDTNMNGALDKGADQLFYDRVDVTVSASAAGNPGGSPSMATPYVNESDIREVGLFLYSSHKGIDFAPNADLRPYQAVFSGTVTKVNLDPPSSNANWSVQVKIQFNSTFTALYVFEPMTPAQADGATQLANIAVSEGQSVSQGDVIGHLFTPGEGAHVHFGLEKFDGSGGDPLACPESYFTSGAKSSILSLITRQDPSAGLCNQ